MKAKKDYSFWFSFFGSIYATLENFETPHSII